MMSFINIPQNSTSVVAEIQCVAYLCVESAEKEQRIELTNNIPTGKNGS